MRGDRPLSLAEYTLTLLATPHARGSTLDGGVRGHCRRGYPACAGIDPKLAGVLVDDGWLPRMRGDRPDQTTARTGRTLATPHARGSTRRRGRHHRQLRGYPACAGIDLWQKAADARRGRLPRMRGDRPTNALLRGDMKTATPHARGSTHTITAGITVAVGYPACAGIDPPTLSTSTTGRGLPRMRGDRPYGETQDQALSEATPHARGSTLWAQILPGWERGYPACAGIDPPFPYEDTLFCWLPRMRGDRPKIPRKKTQCKTATPHARGSTATTLASLFPTIGYPACAGIDPGRAGENGPGPRLPRMRGDRPIRHI